MTRNLAVVALILLGGCAATGEKYAATDPKQIKIYKFVPKRRYEVVGDVQAVATYIPPAANAQVLELTETSVLDVLRENAALRGANAVIITREVVIDPMNHTEGSDSSESTKMFVQGTAIRFLPENPAKNAAKPGP